MPVHLPVTIPVDPHVLAQWRFDERRRWEDQRDPGLQAVSMVLGRWPDRLEFRTRAEVPGVSESARAVAAAAGAPAYRAQLLDIVGKIVQSTGVEGEAHAEGNGGPVPHAEEPAEPADSDDWLSRLDAHLTSPPAPAAQDATQVAPPPAAETQDDLPDFLAPWESAEPAPTAEAEVAPQMDDDAFYVPPAAEPAPAAEHAPAAALASGVPVLDFVVEPDDAPAEESAPVFDAPVASTDAGESIESFAPAEPAAASHTEAAMPATEEPAYDLAPAAPRAAIASAVEPQPSVEVPAFVVPPFSPPQAAVAPPEPQPAPAAQPAAEAAPAPATAVATPASTSDAGDAGARLAALGRDMGLDVWGRAAGASGGARPPVDAAVQVLLDSLDVVWTQGGQFVAAFLVAPRPALHGLLLLSDIGALRPGAQIPFFVVAPEAERGELRNESARPTFARQTPPLAQAFRFIPAEKLDQSLANVGAFLRYLRPEFVEALAERL